MDTSVWTNYLVSLFRNTYASSNCSFHVPFYFAFVTADNQRDQKKTVTMMVINGETWVLAPKNRE